MTFQIIKFFLKHTDLTFYCEISKMLPQEKFGVIFYNYVCKNR